MPRKIARYGWHPDLPDQRDFLYAAPPATLSILPASVDLRPQCPPVFDQGHLGSCFPAGTRVRLADGSQRPIETLRPLDRVLTAEGNSGTVRAIMVRPETEGLVHLLVWGHNLLRLTREHPVLTARGYVPAAQLNDDDWVALPRHAPERHDRLVTAEFLEPRQRIATTGKRSYAAGPNARTATMVRAEVRALPAEIPLTPAFGRIVGLFLAEGCTDYGKVVWTFGGAEEETLVPELVSLLSEELGIVGRIQRRAHGAVKVCVYGMPWVRLFERFCGNGAGLKRPHPLFMGGPRDFQEAMLRGWLDGDGWHSRRGHSGVSISHDLALAMFDIAGALGLRPALNWGKAVQNSAAGLRQPRYTVELASQDDNWRVRQDERHVWRRVRALDREPFVGYVYNLSVEGDESYVAEGIGVHNCTANAIAAAIQFDELKQQMAQAGTPSRLFIYYNERELEGTIDHDSGAQLRDGIKCAAQQGVCQETEWPYDITKFAQQPPPECVAAAAQHTIKVYLRLVQNLTLMKGCLASGYPFVFGFTAYDSFEGQAVAQTGQLGMPGPSEQVIGGHAVLAVGYDDAQQRFIVRNSWGAGWGMQGYFTMPYLYLSQPSLASDFWTIRAV